LEDRDDPEARQAHQIGRSASPLAAAPGAGRTPSHVEIAERAYFIHLQEGERDQVANWLRAERELAAA
jgi:Protein of unknown function (DUF2934)